MAKADFYPRPENDRLAFLDNFVTQATALALSLDIVPMDITHITSVRTDFKTAVTDKTAKKAAAQAAVATADAKNSTAEDILRALVRRIKAHPNYTQAIGAQLGVIGPDGSPNLAGTVADGEGGARPDLAASSVLNGEVTLTFKKNGFTGVEIECQRGTGAAYSFLARDTEAPYIDTRANMADGPESRHYRARYLQKDATVGEYSDVLVVTVPGKV